MKILLKLEMLTDLLDISTLALLPLEFLSLLLLEEAISCLKARAWLGVKRLSAFLCLGEKYGPGTRGRGGKNLRGGGIFLLMHGEYFLEVMHGCHFEFFDGGKVGGQTIF